MGTFECNNIADGESQYCLCLQTGGRRNAPSAQRRLTSAAAHTAFLWKLLVEGLSNQTDFIYQSL